MNDKRPSLSQTDLPTNGDAAESSQYVPARIALIYFAFGFCWIFFGDRLLDWLSVPPERMGQIQTAKGWLFVIGSSVLLYVLLRRHQQRDELAVNELLRSQTEVQRMNAELEARVAQRTQQLEAANRELEAFAYAVSHDLRAPLRSLSAFSQILCDSAPPDLDERSKHYLGRIQQASERMSHLIEDLLGLSRINRAQLNVRPVSLTDVATEAAAVVRERYPQHRVELDIDPDMTTHGDARLLRIAMENLLDNAWKYTARAERARVRVGVQRSAEGTVYFVQDNGVGFDMQYVGKLFAPFQRLHADSDFPGTGIG